MELLKSLRDVNALCRTCLQALSDDTLDTTKHDIFLTPEIAKKLILCTSLSVEPQDGYPKFLCDDCYSKVNSFHQFHKMCVESTKLLGEFLTKSEDDASDSFFEDEKNFDLDVKNEITVEETDMLCKLEEESVVQIDAKPLKQKTKEEALKPSKRKRTKIQTKPKYKRSFTNKALKDSDDDSNREETEKERPKERSTTTTPNPNPSKYYCKQPGCDCVYKNKKSLNMHLRKVHKLGPEVPIQSHVCEFCGTVFKFLKDLKVHRYRHKDMSERPFVCERAPECERRFTTKGKLKVHMLRHEGIKNYVCPHCGLRKTTGNELKVHINYHTLERTWPCSFCTKICKSAVNLKVHERNEHGRAKDYACRFCAKTFAKSTTLKYHEMSHTGENPNACLECGKRYIQPNALRNHMKKHHKDQLAIATDEQTTMS